MIAKSTASMPLSGHPRACAKALPSADSAFIGNRWFLALTLAIGELFSAGYRSSNANRSWSYQLFSTVSMPDLRWFGFSFGNRTLPLA
ncbi:hypothetical protein, partial [Pseudomonas amygdali]|uniref:hypothetical protein n=1 Tax=Pseudomonas amygdali TaxID=47877 RepID=UPI001C80D1D7